jgi:cysteine synthase
LDRLIGNTPLIAIDVRYRGQARRIYAKLESLNLTGSVKDRIALFVLEDAYRRGLIRPGDSIVEAASGNRGILFAAIGRALGHPVTIFMPDWMSSERVALIASFGADIVAVSRDEGRPGHKVGRHRIQGISDEFIPTIVKLDELDDVICGARWRCDPDGAAARTPRPGRLESHQARTFWEPCGLERCAAVMRPR